MEFSPFIICLKVEMKLFKDRLDITHNSVGVTVDDSGPEVGDIKVNHPVTDTTIEG